MSMTADNAVYLKHTREIRDVAANIKNIVNANPDGSLLAGIEKMKLLISRKCFLYATFKNTYVYCVH
jgi:hypothetical protein